MIRLVTFEPDAQSAAPIFSSGGLPTNVNLGPASFDLSAVNLLPPAGFIGGSTITSFTVTAVPEPGTMVPGIGGLIVPVTLVKRAVMWCVIS